MTTFKFGAQNASGVAGEQSLDATFAKHFGIAPATDADQRRGIDRYFTRRDTTPATFTVEYKTDRRARTTHNAFIEVGHSDVPSGGWAHTSRADILVYYVAGDNAEMAYWIDFAILRAQLPRWAALYRLVSVPNQGYDTIGLIVPLGELERIAAHVVQVGDS